MKIVVQRVKHASCTVDKNIISEIKAGYLLLVGFTQNDTIKTVNYLSKKVANLRIFDDEDGKLNKSIIDVSGEILSISQFTIYGDASKGNRPSFTKALHPNKAKILYEKFNNELKQTYNIPTKQGIFGAHMDIQLVNDGPVTIILEKEEAA